MLASHLKTINLGGLSIWPILQSVNLMAFSETMALMVHRRKNEKIKIYIKENNQIHGPVM